MNTYKILHIVWVGEDFPQKGNKMEVKVFGSLRHFGVGEIETLGWVKMEENGVEKHGVQLHLTGFLGSIVQEVQTV